MGGHGSGGWQGRKYTVEESLSLTVADFRKILRTSSSGTLTWPGAIPFSANYSINWDEGVPTLSLQYRWQDEDLRIPVPLQTTLPFLGGVHWWLSCPSIVNGMACNRRAAKLYLPPGAKTFACRACHGLTYRSSQEAHMDERWESNRLMRWVRKLSDDPDDTPPLLARSERNGERAT